MVVLNINLQLQIKPKKIKVKTSTTYDRRPPDNSTYNTVISSHNATVECGLPTTTYGKQPDWAFAEKNKNIHGQYRDGQFRNI